MSLSVLPTMSLGLASGGSAGGEAAYLAAQLADSPVARWRLNETGGTVAVDDVGGYDGIYVASPTLAAAGPWAGSKAAEWNGSTQYAQIPYNSALAPTSAVSIEIWAYRSAWGTQCGIGPNKTDSGGYGLWNISTGNKLRFYLSRGGSYAVIDSINSPAAGWHHIAGTYDGRYSRFYVDGALQGSDDAGASYPIHYLRTNSLVIGADANAGGGYQFPMSGKTVASAVYASALSPARIAAHYAAAGI